MNLHGKRVKRLREHVLKQEAKKKEQEKKTAEPTVTEIKAILDEKGIEYDAKAKKDELIELLRGIE